MTLSFDGSLLRQQGLNGPYTLSRLTLTDASPAVGLDVDTKTDLYTTNAYSFFVFQGPLIDVLRSGTDTAIDTNSNGLYDQLRVTLQVTVLPGGAGRYGFNAALQDPSGSTITFSVAGSQQLNVGTNAITLFYAGRDIGTKGLNGPYRVTNVYLFNDATGLQVTRDNVYQTASYRASQFEGGQVGPQNIAASGNAYLLDGSYRVTLALNARKRNAVLEGNVLINDSRSRLLMRSTLVRSITLPNTDVVLISGDCTVNGASGYTYSLSVTNGVVLNSTDRFSLVIRDSANAIVRQVDNAIAGGNLTTSSN